MVYRPPAIIFINDDLTDNVRSMIEKQLFIDETIDGDTFDSRILADANYATNLKRTDYRLLVIRPMDELDNRTEADIAAFFKNGLISVLYNGFGPPAETFKVVDLTWGKLGVF